MWLAAALHATAVDTPLKSMLPSLLISASAMRSCNSESLGLRPSPLMTSPSSSAVISPESKTFWLVTETYQHIGSITHLCDPCQRDQTPVDTGQSALC